MFLQLTPVTNIDVKEALMDIIKASIDNNARFKELENDDREYDESYRRNKERFLEHEERLWKYVKRTDPKRQKFQSKCIQISKEILDENPIVIPNNQEKVIEEIVNNYYNLKMKSTGKHQSEKKAIIGQMRIKVTTDIITLTRHVLDEQRKYKDASGDLTTLLNAIQLGCKFVATNVRKARLLNLVGLAGGATNISGDEQKKLDVISNEIFVNALCSSGKVAVMVSEEDEQAIIVEEGLRGKYCVVFDPLDGSSNIDAGVNVGTIFGIYKMCEGSTGSISDVLRPGSDMVIAGYCMYGSSANMVITLGNGVNGYTLDNIKIPSRGKIYSVNEGNEKYWYEPCKKYFNSLKYPPEGKNPYSARYIGSMVADVHRTLLYGGIFAYPADKKSKNGKLRILYECFPMAFLTEQSWRKSYK
ncbi:12073_t:CDS:2 [Entrophospora sp. SA101]|nr:12073_t:CDS:2 [Entrophospora sp. SA101]